MLENGSMSPADLSAVIGNDGMGGSNAWVWFLVILFLFGFGNGGWGTGNALTQSELQSGFDTQSLLSKLNGLENGICDLGYNQQGIMNGINQNVSQQGYNVTTAVNGVSTQLGELACGINRNIDSVRYDNALNTQKIMENDCNNTQKILDAITQNQINAMQNEINSLQLQSNLANVVRYPTVTAYSAGYNPFYGYGGNI